MTWRRLLIICLAATALTHAWLSWVVGTPLPSEWSAEVKLLAVLAVAPSFGLLIHIIIEELRI